METLHRNTFHTDVFCGLLSWHFETERINFAFCFSCDYCQNHYLQIILLFHLIKIRIFLFSKTKQTSIILISWRTYILFFTISTHYERTFQARKPGINPSKSLDQEQDASLCSMVVAWVSCEFVTWSPLLPAVNLLIELKRVLSHL